MVFVKVSDGMRRAAWKTRYLNIYPRSWMDDVDISFALPGSSFEPSDKSERAPVQLSETQVLYYTRLYNLPLFSSLSASNFKYPFLVHGCSREDVRLVPRKPKISSR